MLGDFKAVVCVKHLKSFNAQWEKASLRICDGINKKNAKKSKMPISEILSTRNYILVQNNKAEGGEVTSGPRRVFFFFIAIFFQEHLRLLLSSSNFLHEKQKQWVA